LRRVRLPSTTSQPLLLALAAGAVGACGGAPVPVEARVTVAGLPVAGLEVTALPYDPIRLLDSLATAHDVPLPEFEALERELLSFTAEPAARDDSIDLGVRATRDSAAALADSLRAVDRRSRGYAEAYQRFRRLYGRLIQRAAGREAARRGVRDPLRALALRAGRAADSLRAWEQDAYAGLDAAVALEEDRAGRGPVAGVTDATGRVTLMLPPGRWWLDARLEDERNPFAEHRWLVPVVTAGLPFRVPLSEATATTVWRH
jgi:hypothetical protein